MRIYIKHAVSISFAVSCEYLLSESGHRLPLSTLHHILWCHALNLSSLRSG